jgi:DNA-directed RNA polymerase specialized sigma24 family protein
MSSAGQREMKQEKAFDAFYRATRSDLLLQSFLLTGDLTAAQSAVRDAYATAWHHWRKVGVLGDPLAYVRPLAWRLAQRRHSGRLWHRQKGLTDEQKRVLDALHGLPASTRRLLLLTELAGLGLRSASREVALAHGVAETRLRDGRATLLESLGTDDLRGRLLDLSGPASTAVLPRPSSVLRAGRKRRRLQTLGAVLGVTALTLGAGVVAREPGIERATAVHQLVPGGEPGDDHLPDDVALTTADQLLEPNQLAELAPGQMWRATRTDNNTRGDGLNTLCQETRFADPHGLNALLRVFKADGRPRRTGLQAVEISRTPAAAERTYRTMVGWFAGCQEARVELQSAYRVDGVGDEASLLQLRLWRDPVSTYTVGIARVHAVTTLTVATTVDSPAPKPRVVAGVLADAVSKLCPTDRDGCAATPSVEATPPPSSGDHHPGFLSTVDLPPVGRITKPWVGVRPINAMRNNVAATMCDRAHFGRGGAAGARSRVFLIPQAKLPRRFGLVETVGEFRSAKAAATFLQRVRGSVSGCEDRDLTAEVSAEHRITRANRRSDLSAWRFSTEVSDDVVVTFRIGFVRVGDRVAQLTFIPTARDDIRPAQFNALVQRAGERLHEVR